jgi:hypothetical protein
MAGSYGIYGNYGNLGGYGYNQPYNAGFQTPQTVVAPQPQLRTNKVFVTSLEDALSRNAEPNTIMVYRHQDEKFEYEIYTDMQGKKTYKTLALTDYSTVEPHKEQGGILIPEETLKGIEGRISALEGVIFKKKEDKENKKNGGLE